MDDIANYSQTESKKYIVKYYIFQIAFSLSNIIVKYLVTYIVNIKLIRRFF